MSSGTMAGQGQETATNLHRGIENFERTLEFWLKAFLTARGFAVNLAQIEDFKQNFAKANPQMMEVRTQESQEFERRLNTEGIQFQKYDPSDPRNPNSFYMIKGDDKQRAYEIKNQILYEKGTYFIETSIDELRKDTLANESYDLDYTKMSLGESLIRRREKDNREIFLIEDLPEAEVYDLRNRCNEMYGNGGITVGIDYNHEERNYDFAIREEYLIDIDNCGVEELVSKSGEHTYLDSSKNDFAKIYLDSRIELFGEKREEFHDLIAEEKDFEEELTNISVPVDGDFKYIVSDENKNRYIKLTDEGFTLFNQRLDEEKKMIETSVVAHVRKDDPDYRSMLKKYAIQMHANNILEGNLSKNIDVETLLKNHLVSKPQINPLNAIRQEEKRIADTIDKMVRDAMKDMQKKKPSLKDRSNLEKFDDYRQRCAYVIEQVSNGQIPEGYNIQRGKQLILDIHKSKNLQLEHLNLIKDAIKEPMCFVEKAMIIDKEIIRENQIDRDKDDQSKKQFANNTSKDKFTGISNKDYFDEEIGDR